MKQARLLALDLTAQNKGAVELVAMLAQISPSRSWISRSASPTTRAALNMLPALKSRVFGWGSSGASSN